MKTPKSAVVLGLIGSVFAIGWSHFAAVARGSAPTRTMSGESLRQHVPGGPAMSLEFENASVRAFRIRIAPHARLAMHDVTPRVVVWLTAAHLRDSLATGEIRMEEHKAGDVTWVPAQRHSGVNLSGAAIEFIAIEPKATH